MPANPSLDELRTNLRRTQILEAATRVFAEKGYHRATTKDIARAAGMAEGTIYLYFENKSELLIALMEHLDQATTQTPDLNAGLEMSPRALLTKRLEEDLAQLGPNFDVLLAILPEVLADPFLRPQYYQRLVVPGLEGLAGHLQIRQERGEVNIANIPMAVRIFMAAMLGMEMLHILGDETVREAWKNPADLAENMARVLLDGLQPIPR
ncbi:MAG: helix-turn-helix domain-containing protein [Anaerolineales bacterium]|jgi:AcrR family transcriptional regulator